MSTFSCSGFTHALPLDSLGIFQVCSACVKGDLGECLIWANWSISRHQTSWGNLLWGDKGEMEKMLEINGEAGGTAKGWGKEKSCPLHAPMHDITTLPASIKALINEGLTRQSGWEIWEEGWGGVCWGEALPLQPSVSPIRNTWRRGGRRGRFAAKQGWKEAKKTSRPIREIRPGL